MTNPSTLIHCSMCGCTFDPVENAACEACPLHAGCTLVCCPMCGYETVDVSRSKLASWVTAIRKRTARGDR